MSQAELGQRIGVTRQTITAIEAGKYSPFLEAAFRMAQVFNLPLEEVFQWDAKATHWSSCSSNRRVTLCDQSAGTEQL
jgi:putative transcriptional regulator